MDPSVINFVNRVSTGSSVITMSGPGGYSMSRNGNQISYSFNSQISEQMLKEMWKLYQTKINEVKLDKAPETYQCLNTAEELIKTKFRPNYECTPLDSSQNPEVYFEKAKKLKAIIKEIFISKVRSTNSVSLVDNCFTKKLDKSERLVVQAFYNLFELYLKQENYEQAFIAAKKIGAASWKYQQQP